MTIFGISILNLIVFALFGFVVGFIIHKIDPKDAKGGVFATTILGIAGALVGGFLSTFLFGHTANSFSIQGFLTALFGGLILAGIHRLLFRGQNSSV